MRLSLKIILTVLIIIASLFVGIFTMLVLAISGVGSLLSFFSTLILPSIALALVWFWKHRKKIFTIWIIAVSIYCLCVGIPYIIDLYDKSITINTSPNIMVDEYLPFNDKSKIVKIDSELKLTDPLPVIDGAAAVFPVYSAFVNATYPSDTELYNGIFEYNNTSHGYKLLAEGKTDVFFGAYPSPDQIAYAEECGNEFEYTPIGSEAFVFFVHKNNPINNLTTEQIQGIYSGRIKNWAEVGGRNEKIVAYQRNEGSGSQSMLRRFMGDVQIMDAPSEQVNDFMSGIIEQVADYKSTTASIGFSFRYYVEGIIQNPDIKMISIDGIAPTVENIKNGTYPITTSLYAVSNENEENENVQKLIEWVLSDEGQKIIEDTGYVGIN